jgi:hypothetical protein
VKEVDDGSTRDREIKTVMADFCMKAMNDGTSAADRAATIHLVAAAAYLQESAGPARTREILSAVIASIGFETELKH